MPIAKQSDDDSDSDAAIVDDSKVDTNDDDDAMDVTTAEQIAKDENEDQWQYPHPTEAANVVESLLKTLIG